MAEVAAEREAVLDASAMVDLLLDNAIGRAVAARVAGHGLHGPAHLDAERPPRERCLKNALSEIASEEQSVRAVGSQRRQEPKFGDPDILCLINDDEIEWRFAALGQVSG